jgi:uncharacterized protein YbcC (UPF0753/DUF2309 family)
MPGLLPDIRSDKPLLLRWRRQVQKAHPLRMGFFVGFFFVFIQMNAVQKNNSEKTLNAY